MLTDTTDATVTIHWNLHPASEPLIETIRAAIIGDGDALEGPYGIRRITNADHTASARSFQIPERGAIARYPAIRSRD